MKATNFRVGQDHYVDPSFLLQTPIRERAASRPPRGAGQMFRIRRHWTNPSDSNLTGQTSPITNSSKRTERLPTSLTNICEDARSAENPPPSVDPAVPRYREDLRAMFSRKKCPQNPELAAFVRKSTPSSVDSGVLRVTFRWAAADTPTWLISAARNSGPEMRFRSTKWSDELAVLGNDWKQRYYAYARGMRASGRHVKAKGERLSWCTRQGRLFTEALRFLGRI